MPGVPLNPPQEYKELKVWSHLTFFTPFNAPFNAPLNRLIRLKPILSVIQPVTIDTMLNKNGPF